MALVVLYLTGFATFQASDGHAPACCTRCDEGAIGGYGDRVDDRSICFQRCPAVREGKSVQTVANRADEEFVFVRAPCQRADCGCEQGRAVQRITCRIPDLRLVVSSARGQEGALQVPDYRLYCRCMSLINKGALIAGVP